MSIDSASSEDTSINYWEEKLENLRGELENYFESEQDGIQLMNYSVRKLGNDDYVISTPGKVFYLGENPVNNPQLQIHERGSPKDGYSQGDKELEKLIEDELEMKS